MALTECQDCRREVPAQTTVCPHCGAQQLAASMAGAAASGVSGPSTFRRPPAPPPHSAGSVSKQAVPSSPRTKPAREAVVRQRLLWGGGATAVVLFLLGLARTVTMWMVLAPLGVLCLGAMGIGLLRGLQNKGLPALPHTRRVHSLLLVLATPILFAVAVAIVPKTAEEQRHFDEIQRLDAQQRADREGRLDAHVACRVYIQERLKVPSTAEFSTFPAIVPREEGGYMVRGTVDAQNAFGAKLRRNYLCAVDSGGHVISASVIE